MKAWTKAVFLLSLLTAASGDVFVAGGPDPRPGETLFAIQNFQILGLPAALSFVRGNKLPSPAGTLLFHDETKLGYWEGDTLVLIRRFPPDAALILRLSRKDINRMFANVATR